MRRYIDVRAWLLTLISVFLLTSCGSVRAPSSVHSNVIPWIAASPPAPTPTPKPTLPAGTPACTVQGLQTTFVGGGGLGGGQLYASVDFANRGSVACYLEGVPKVSLRDSTGQLMQTHLSGYVVDDRKDPVLLTPHGVEAQAYVTLVWPAIDLEMGGTECPSPAAATISMELPSNGGAVMLSSAAALHEVTIAPCHGAIAVGAFQPAEPSVEPTPPPPQLSYHVVAPASVEAGHDLQYTVTLTNVTTTTFVFGEGCPIYHEDLYPGDGAVSVPLGKHVYALNCGPVGPIAAGANVTFAMVLDVPATAPTGRYTLLWSGNGIIKDIQRVPIQITSSP